MSNSSKAPTARLLTGDVSTALREMSAPMLFGLIAMIFVNLIDTYWVSRLGTESLAAMTFTFPVAAIVINIALGLMIGTSVAVSRAIGAGRADEARLLTTHASILAAGVVAVLSSAGLLLQEPLFRAMGAEGVLLENVTRYMTPWFIGVAFLVVPMIANGALRATGDAKTPSRIMVMAAIINALLDPLLIFGWGPVPALGIEGAAIATVIARLVTMVVVFAVLIRRTKLLGLAGTTWAGMLASWRTVGRVAVPAMVTNAVGPFAVGLLTTMVARHGPGALAGWGIGARVDSLVLMVPNALSAGLSPFVGQNWGAHLRARVADAIRQSLWFSVAWGAIAAALLIAVAPTVASLFSDEADVQTQVVTYLRVIPVGFAFIGVVSMCSSTFNAVDRATRSTVLSVLRSLLLAVPLAWVGDQLAGIQGLFLGLVIGSVVSAFLGVLWMRTFLFPLGKAPPGASKPLTVHAMVQWLEDEGAWPGVSDKVPEIISLDGLQARMMGSDQLGLYIGARELMHFEAGGTIDLSLPVEVGDNLVRLGMLVPHPDYDANGWYRKTASTELEADKVAWLVGLTHLLYALSERGAADPITQAELDKYTYTPACEAAMKAAAKRWSAEARAA